MSSVYSFPAFISSSRSAAASRISSFGYRYPKEEIREAAADLEELINAGKLYTEDIYENYIQEIVEAKKPVVKALCLHIAHDCNLACRYCFAEEGEYHGRRALMSYEVGKKRLIF